MLRLRRSTQPALDLSAQCNSVNGLVLSVSSAFGPPVSDLLPSACRVTVSHLVHAAVVFRGVSPLPQTPAHLRCRLPAVGSGFHHCASSWRFVPFLLRWPGSTTVEFGPYTPRRLRSLRCTLTSETRVPMLLSEFSMTPSGHS